MEDVLDIGVGMVGPTGHEGGVVACAVFTTRGANAEVEEAFVGDEVHAALGVLVPLIVAVDDAVAGVEVVGEGRDGVVNWGAGLDEMMTDLGRWRERTKSRGVYWLVRGREPSLVHAALDVLVPLVVVVDDVVVGVEVVEEGDDGMVDWGVDLDEDDDGSGVLEGKNEEGESRRNG